MSLWWWFYLCSWRTQRHNHVAFCGSFIITIINSQILSTVNITLLSKYRTIFCVWCCCFFSLRYLVKISGCCMLWLFRSQTNVYDPSIIMSTMLLEVVSQRHWTLITRIFCLLTMVFGVNIKEWQNSGRLWKTKSQNQGMHKIRKVCFVLLKCLCADVFGSCLLNLGNVGIVKLLLSAFAFFCDSNHYKYY